MFRKISAKPPKSKTIIPDAPDAPNTKKPKEGNPLAPGLAQAGTAAGVAGVSELLQQLKSSQNPVDRAIAKVMDFAKDKGQDAERLQQELGEREVLISQLLQYMPEDLLAKYFDEFLFVRDIPWTMTREFMDKAVKAENVGANAREVLDFSLVFYDKRRNFGNTISIIDTAMDLQPQMRNVNIFKSLKESLTGSRNAGLNFMLIGPKNIDKAIVLNKLMGMVAARGAEDLEVLRRDFQKSKDQLQRKREVADRFRGIYDTMLSIEFQSALKRNVQFITEQFALSVNDPNVQAFARILYDIKLGQEFRKESFAGLESRATAEQQASTSQAPQRSNIASTQRFVKAQVAQNTINPAAVVEFRKYITILKDKNVLLLNWATQEIQKKNPLAIKVSGILKDSDIKLESILSNLNAQKPNLQNDYKIYIEVTKNYEAIDGFVKSAKNQTKVSNFNNKFIKISQNSNNPLFNAPGTIGTRGPNMGLGGAQGTLLSDELGKFANTAFTAAAGVTIVGGAITGNFVSALAAGAALFLHSKNEHAINLAKLVGAEPPKDQTDAKTLATAEEVFKSLGEDNSYVKEYLANDEFIDQIDGTIQTLEKNLLLIIDANVKTGDGSENAPLESPEKVDKAYRDFMSYLRQSNQAVSRQLDLIDTMSAIISKNPDVTIQNKLGYVRAFREAVFNKVENIRTKISEYGSLTEIIGNMQKQKFLLQKLKEILPQLDKYLVTGLSTADVLAGDGGLLDKLKDYIAIERDSYNKLYKQWNDLVNQFPSLRNTSTAPEAPQGQANVNVPASVAPVSTPTVSTNVTSDRSGNIMEGGDIEGYSKAASVQFTNLIFERNVKLAAGVDPQQQAKYNYYIGRMNQPGINMQNLVRALDGDMTFTDANLKLLARNAILAKSANLMGSEFTTPTAYEGSFVDEQGHNVPPPQQSNQQNQQTTTITGVQPRPGSMNLAQDEDGPETQPGQPLPSQAEVDIFTQVKKIYSEFEKQFGNYGIMPSLNTVQSDPKRMIASMRAQLVKVFANIQNMEKIYYQLLQNPTDFGGVLQGLSK